MTRFGYTLSSEEHGPAELVEYARLAEAAGFDFAMVSDHFHPWTDRQGHSPFVWSTLAAASQVTSSLQLATGVTCPTTRIHPAIIAQAAATTAALLPGRFSLGVGSGERLNEHVVGGDWPPIPERQDRLVEAVEVIRKLWTGKEVSHRGEFFRVDSARIYTLPDEPPPILVASGGERATRIAGNIGDGLVGLAPDPHIIESFRESGGEGKPCYAQVHVCWADSEKAGQETALEWWPNTALGGNLFIELPRPAEFEAATADVNVDDIAEKVPCGPDPEPLIEEALEYVDAGYTHVYFHQIGPDQAGFIDFAERELLPALRKRTG